MIADQTFTEKDFLNSTFQATGPIAASGAFLLSPIEERQTLGTVPDDLLYGGSVHPELRTVRPFAIHFERTETGYAAVALDLDEFGVGETRSEALEDLRHTLRELYLSLERDENRLSEDLRSVWGNLKTHLVRMAR